MVWEFVSGCKCPDVRTNKTHTRTHNDNDLYLYLKRHREMAEKQQTVNNNHSPPTPPPLSSSRAMTATTTSANEDDNFDGVTLFGNATLDMKPLEQHLKPFAITVVVTFASASQMWRSRSSLLVHMLSDIAPSLCLLGAFTEIYSTQPSCKPSENESKR